MKPQNILISSIFPYISVIIGFILSFYNKDIENYKNLFFFWFLWLILKDIFMYTVDIKPTSLIVIDKDAMDYDQLGIFKNFIIWNRRRLFPFLLTFYIINIFIDQTHIFWLDKTRFLWFFNQQLQLILLIILGISTLFYENIEKKYEKKISSLNYSILWISLSFCLAFLWSFVILWQTSKLWNLSFFISLISWILIFLIWILTLNDDNDKTFDTSETHH